MYSNVILSVVCLVFSVICAAMTEKGNVTTDLVDTIRDLTGSTNVTTEATDIMPGVRDGTLEGTNGTLGTNVTLGANGTLTTNGTGEVETVTRICTDTEWRCNDGRCIDRQGLCNGQIECGDASDEYRQPCKDHPPPRPMFGLVLHCTSFWSDFHYKLCPRICHDEPEYCYYALIAENGLSNTCVFPEYPEHGSYRIKVNASDKSEQPDFSLAYYCDMTYVLVEEAKQECVNGTWHNENVTRYCSEACPVQKRENFTYSCPKGSESDLCGDYVAINSVVTVGRIQPSQDDERLTEPVFVHIQCMDTKEFNLTTECVDEVDNLQNSFEKPTMDKMTDYETKFNQIKNNDTSYDVDFETLVDEFHKFEGDVKDNLTMMHLKAEQCDILLDLLLLNLEEKQKGIAKEQEKNQQQAAPK